MTLRHRALGEVARLVRGLAFKPDDRVPAGTPGAIACMRTSNIQHLLDDSDRTYIPARLVKRDEQHLRQGDILVSTANSWNLVGKCCWVPRLDYPATLGGFIALLRVEASDMSPRYVYHWLAARHTQHRVRRCARWTTQIANLDRARFLDLELPVPAISEQRRIAAILDRADAIRHKRARALSLVDELVAAAFHRYVGDPTRDTCPAGWTRAPLGTLVRRVVVGHVGAISDAYCDTGVAFLRTGNIRPMRIERRGLRRISQAFHQRLRKSQLAAGDVVIARVGVNRGMAATVPPDLDGANCANIVIVSPGESLRGEYLAALINSPHGQHALLGASVGAAQGVINTAAIKRWPTLVPDLEVQDRFQAFVERSHALRYALERSASTTDDLFHALAQTSFRGLS